MELTSKFSLNGTDNIDGEPISPANWINAFVNLSFDKDSVIAKSKGTVSTTEWEFIAKSATFLKEWQQAGLISGVGVLEGVPFKWELLDDGASVELFKGYVNLSTALFQCDSVTASVREEQKIDDLNSKVDSFSYEYLMSIGVLKPSDYTYVPYCKRPIQNLGIELVVAIIELILLIIQLQQAISELVKLIIGLATFTWADLFKAIIQTAYVLFLTATVNQAVENILKLIIQPVKFHAGMTELRLMQIGAEYLGYDFVSDLLENENPNAVIIPEKWNLPTQENDDLITGFTTVEQMIVPINLNESNRLQQNGYYNGTFGDVIRALKTKYNAKVVIEENPSGVNPIFRFEREDYIGDTNALYDIPPIDNNDSFRLNVDEFRSNYLIEYQLDSSNKVGYLDYGGTIFQATIFPRSVSNPANTLMSGLENKTIPFAKGSRKNELTKVEKLTGPLVQTVADLAGLIALITNVTLVQVWYTGYGMIIDVNNIISAVNGLPLGLNIPLISTNIIGSLEQIPLIDFPNFAQYTSNRIGMMEVENDFLNIPHNIVLDSIQGEFEGGFTGSQLVNDVIDYFYYSTPFENYRPILENQTPVGNFVGNVLVANHSREIGAKTLWKKYHSINSFVPNTEGDPDDTSNPKHNQWKIYEFENVPFCYEDYIKVKNNNNITFVGKVGRVETLEWDVYNQTANISFRVNELWTKNLNLSSNEPIGR